MKPRKTDIILSVPIQGKAHFPLSQSIGTWLSRANFINHQSERLFLSIWPTMEKWKQTVAVTPPRKDWLVKLWVLVITLFKCSTQSYSLGLILKLLANSLAFDSHSFPLPCHHPSHFQHSCPQPDKYVDFCLLHSMDLFSTVLPASPSHSQLWSAKLVWPILQLSANGSHWCKFYSLGH